MYGLQFNEPVRIDTKAGPRMLSKAESTGEFWKAWRTDKDAMRANGYSCGKDRETGAWQVCLWASIDTEARAESVVASRQVAADIDIPAPAGLEYMPFQLAGIAYALEHKNTLIGDEMGLGKTIQAIGVINATDPGATIIVCPASLRLNWERECQKWLTVDKSISVMTAKIKQWPAADIVIVNYDILNRYAIPDCDLLIVDEAHYCKNKKTKRTKAVFGINANRKLFLTGTPLLNRPKELAGIAHHLAPGEFASEWKFLQRYTNAAQTRYGWDFSGYSNLDELGERLRASCMVRRLKKDVLTELPDKTRQTIVLPTNGATVCIRAEQNYLKQYGDFTAETFSELSSKTAAFAELAKLRHETAIKKVPHVIEHVRDLEKVVIFAHHTDVITGIAAEFGDECVTLTGSTSLLDRQAAVDRFQSDPACKYFIGSIKAAGVGLTLTAASHVVFAELTFVPGDISQAEDRCHRIGQSDNVLVQHLVFDGSIDVMLANMIIEKQEVITAVLDTETEKAEKPDLPKIEKMDKPANPDMPKWKKNEIHAKIRFLASRCDGAIAEDGVGFNGRDAKFGRDLASTCTITDRQAKSAEKMLEKYKNTQLAGFVFP